MKNIPAWRRYLRFLRNDIANDVDEELRFHVEMRVAEYVARGMSEEDARRAVADRLGDVVAAKASCVEEGHVRERHSRNADLVDGLRADIHFALRSLARAPGWTAVALLTMALGVGATTSVFSVAYPLLVRPFPYPDADRVYLAQRTWTTEGRMIPSRLPSGILPEWRAHARTIESIVPYNGGGAASFVAGTDSFDIHAVRVGRDFLAFAGAHPLRGRNFDAGEMRPGGPAAVLLGEALWRREYGASEDAIGKIVRIDGEARTIVGIVPGSLVIPEFRSERADVLTPLPEVADGGWTYLVRLKPGVSPTVAADELQALLQHANVTDRKPVPVPMPVRLMRPQDWLGMRQPLVLLTAGVGLLLIVSCTNVAHLLLAKGAARQRELAVRNALGAGRARILRQLVTESVVLAALGGVFAAVVGWAGLHMLSTIRPASEAALTYVSADGRVALIASALAILVGVVVGLMAGLRTSSQDPAETLRAGASSASPGGRRLRSALVVGEVSLSATLLVGALLLIHAVFDLQRANLGFDARGLYAVSFPLPQNAPAATRTSFAAELRARTAVLSGVDAITLASSVPGPRGVRMLGKYETPDRAASPTDATQGTDLYFVEPDYFAALHIPIVAGRTFDQGSADRNEVIISQTLAREVWPDGHAVGHELRNAMARTRGPNDPWQTVIGVVPDVTPSLVEDTARPGLYRPLHSNKPDFMSDVVLIVRTRDEAAAARLRAFAVTVHPHANTKFVSVRAAIDETMAEPRFTMRILALFALLAVFLAAIGLYGVISFGVGQRTREIGVRMTLGASRPSIARLVMGDGVRLSIVGVTIGLFGAAMGTRLIQSQLYGLSRLDPFAFVAGTGVLLVVAVVACVVPMWRATAVDPAIAVRAE